MKKVLISVLLVLLTLCLFVSCKEVEPTPTTKTISVYDIKGPSTLLFTFDVDLNNTKRWSEYTDTQPYSIDGGILYREGNNVLYDIGNGCCYLYKSPSELTENKLSSETPIKDTPTTLYIKVSDD